MEELLVAIDGLETERRLNTSYIEHLLTVLRRTGQEYGEVLDFWKKVGEHNTTIKDLIGYEHKEYAVRKVSIGNSIISLHTIGTLDWNQIFEL